MLFAYWDKTQNSPNFVILTIIVIYISPTMRGYSEVTLQSSTTSHFFSMTSMLKIYFQAGFVFGFFTIGFRRYGPFSLITAALFVLFAIPVE